MRTRLAIALLASLSVAARDAEFDKAKAEFKRAIAELGTKPVLDLTAKPGPEPSGKAVGDAADRLAGTDQKAAVDALLEGYGTLATQVKNLWTDKVRLLREKDANGDFQVNMKTNPPSIPKSDVPKAEAFFIAEKQSQIVELKIMAIESGRRGIVAALGRFKGDASVKDMLKELSTGSPWQRRAGVAEALGQMASTDIPAALGEVVKKDSEPQVRIAAMDALRELKANSPEITAALIEQLKSDLWQLKATAAATIKALKIKEAVEPLVDALSKSEGRLRMDLNDALVALTGADKHGDPAAWKSWWESNREAFAQGTYAAKPGDGAGDGPKNATTFYGIPVTSKNVIFILDRSGSMLEPSEWEAPADVATGGAAGAPEIKKEGNRKIDVARWQLKKTLAMMPDEAEFNIIFFNYEVVALSKEMLKISASTRKKAYDFIDHLEPLGETNTYDALERAFTYVTSGPMGDKLIKGGVDSFFLLTDGMPNGGQITRAPDIVVKIRELNRTRKVKINTVGIFSTPRGALLAGQANEAEEGSKFLKQMAEDSGGKYTNAGAGAAGSAMPAPAGKKKP
jgi:hypothetical protein